MSTRTVIEVNHDNINDLMDRDAHVLFRMLMDLRSGALPEEERAFLAARGIRVLGQRHHSETLALEVS